MRLFFVLLILLLNFQSPIKADVGVGNITLSDRVINDFYYYIKEKRKTPVRFLVTEDGSSSIGWFCPYAKCAPTGSSGEINNCKMRTGKTCYVFAVKRTIRWKNDVTTGLKTSKRKFSSKDSLSDVKNKLSKLGFTSNNETKISKAKVEKSDATTDKSIDLASQIKKLKELFDAGVLTEEEFNLAKQKVLFQ